MFGVDRARFRWRKANLQTMSHFLPDKGHPARQSPDRKSPRSGDWAPVCRRKVTMLMLGTMLVRAEVKSGGADSHIEQSRQGRSLGRTSNSQS